MPPGLLEIEMLLILSSTVRLKVLSSCGKLVERIWEMVSFPQPGSPKTAISQETSP